MMGRRGVVVLVAMCWLAGEASQAQNEEPRFSLLVKSNLTTSSQIFPNPNAADEVLRAETHSVGSFFGFGAELRYRFPESNVALGISADYLHGVSSSSIKAFPLVVPVEDGYRVVPVELTGYFLIPVSGPTVGVFMGGGIGAYFGKRTYMIGDTEAPSSSGKPGFGIHVLGGVSYRFTPWLLLQAEMKFRDLQFEGVNQFTQSRIVYRGTFIDVGQAPFESSIHTDGIVLQLGAAITL